MNNYSETIYKLDSKGKVRFLTVSTEGADLIQESGLLDSASPVTHRSTCVGKNIGRANETTPEVQALFEARAKATSKRDEGYFDSVEEAKNNPVILPMLAKSAKDRMDKIKYPCFAQPKLDGMRALGKKDTVMQSRKGKDIDTMGHIQAELDASSIEHIFDGELYAHGLNFQQNMRIIKKDRGEDTKKVQFHVYDLVLPDYPFEERYKTLSRMVDGFSNIVIVPTYRINNEEELKKLHSKFLNEGYEGTILRHSSAGYAINKRDDQLLKYKDFIDEACEIVDVVPSEKNPTRGVVHCKMQVDDETSVTFGCGMKFSHKEQEDILTNKIHYIGKTAEIRFFEYSESGLPRFPVCCGFRIDL